MKKLLTLVVCCSLSAPSFGVDWIKDRVYASLSGGAGANVDLGYHYADSIKISVGGVIKPIIGKEFGGGAAGLMTKLHYHHEFESTDITPYITAGVGVVLVGTVSVTDPRAMKSVIEAETIEEIGSELKKNVTFPVADKFFSWQIGFGANLPLSERTNVFAGYKLQRFHKIFHGVELGVSFNL